MHWINMIRGIVIYKTGAYISNTLVHSCESMLDRDCSISWVVSHAHQAITPPVTSPAVRYASAFLVHSR